jgi:hypothetical protein
MSSPDPQNLQQNNTVASQQSKSFSSTVQDVGSAISGGISAATPVLAGLAAVSAISGKLGGKGLAAVAALGTAMNAISGFTSATKFKDTYKYPAKVRDIPPEKAKRSGFSQLTFPQDIGDYYISFTFKKYDRKVPLGNRVDLPQGVINLPIPTNLQEQFSMQYADKQLGVAGFLEKELGTALGGTTSGTSESWKKAGEDIGKTMASKEAVFYGARSIAGLSDSVGGAVDKATGTVLNPYQSLLFQGVNLRSHSFSYRFSPNNKAESETLKNIIKEFKKRMHPGKDNLLYYFPDVCDIAFGKSAKEPYFFKTCFLESMSVNYAPQGTPAFFAENFNPVEVEVSLSFKEIEPLTRDDF